MTETQKVSRRAGARAGGRAARASVRTREVESACGEGTERVSFARVLRRLVSYFDPLTSNVDRLTS